MGLEYSMWTLQRLADYLAEPDRDSRVSAENGASGIGQEAGHLCLGRPQHTITQS